MIHPPGFEVALDGIVVMRPPFWPQTNYTGIPDDYFKEEYGMSVKSGFLNLCFYNTVGDDPLIAAIELDEMHPLSYGGSALTFDLILTISTLALHYLIWTHMAAHGLMAITIS